MTKNRELIIPPKAEQAEEAYEIVRVWLTQSGPLLSLLPNIWSDPASWGLLMVDIAEHAASAISNGNHADKEAVLARIREGFDAEWSERTGNARGGFVMDE